MVLHSTFPDFVLFLYVHVARIDESFEPEEITTIKSKMSRLFPENTDLEKKLYQAIRSYNSFDRSKIEEVVKDSFAHFQKDRTISQSKLFADVREIVEADGKILPVEYNALQALMKILEKM